MSAEFSQVLKKYFGDKIAIAAATDCITLEVAPENLLWVATKCRDEFHFEELVDVCGVDYSDYGVNHWRTHETTESGFNRGVDEKGERKIMWNKPRFASVYHLLSISKNNRLRIKVFLAEEPVVPSVIDIWKSADWFERESYDLFGIVYEGHPDLRRILTDYGFRGHPFRKDFPLIGEVEMRYDAKLQRCVYEPVSIEPRTLVPKVIKSEPCA
ncbi:MAG: NADH-quinone oxidoreductase subunit C [Gammaproteobacteria bacterium RIFCSPLOWO2_02_FULL_42_14]|nr:MAG: NADH-quinone oxidoreductase subunit C [Gammaproteobacteria bacterium RIFCSPHIGHO2_02_FULL_42_43]OGT27303.1 MAG: NADH-quinone oxidoreductase subunit C [Gammaproteobacteria bacterium RIFCSPHIGHO2_01_FULL_42_8]OGT52978.1 MAG: NADH-quinone oxidoreductase subunit C [Gammaproteobacteria bacterium RIFCSPHIGHO2_12_FULL_41_25]OGT61248.1 MAG: NADH-quinone oxidoreductase subunit C [Gammaproteobacteria bacterium RIFCSPLOWO2_02_FULL_42_14]OGT87177.1 MAG: NADH-quinone oxidoreductase subunit C [Gammap